MRMRIDLVPLLPAVLTLIGMPQTVGAAPPRPQGPCDIYAAAGTPCVAAHSTTRARLRRNRPEPETRGFRGLSSPRRNVPVTSVDTGIAAAPPHHINPLIGEETPPGFRSTASAAPTTARRKTRLHQSG